MAVSNNTNTTDKEQIDWVKKKQKYTGVKYMWNTTEMRS